MIFFLVFFALHSAFCNNLILCSVPDVNTWLDDLQEHVQLNPQLKPLYIDPSMSYMDQILHAAKFFSFGLFRDRKHVETSDIEPCFFIDDDDEDGEVTIPIPRFETEQQMYRFFDIMGFGFVETVFNFTGDMIQNSTREEYCNQTFLDWRTKILQFVTCNVFKWFRSPNITTNITNNKFMEQYPNGDYGFRRSIQEATLPLVESKKLAEKVYTNMDVQQYPGLYDRLQHLKDQAWEEHPHLNERLEKITGGISKLWKILRFKPWNTDTAINNVLENTDKLKPYLYQIRHQIQSNQFMHNVWNQREQTNHNETNPILLYSSFDPNVISLNRPIPQKSVSVVVHDILLEEYIFGIELPYWTGFGALDQHIVHVQLVPLTVFLGRLVYLFLSEWIFGAGDVGQPCHPRFPYLPDSSEGCVYPWFQVPTITFLEDFFPGVDFTNPQCNQYRTPIDYFIGIIEVFMPGQPANLFSCLILNSFLILATIYAALLILTILIPGVAFLWWWWAIERRRVEDEQRDIDITDELNHLGHDNAIEEYNIRDIRRILKQHQEEVALLRKELIRMTSIKIRTMKNIVVH